MLKNPLFYCKNKDTYPPFKCGMYMEEYFLHNYNQNNMATKRVYIPVLWTNFQIENWFNHHKTQMKSKLNDRITKNQSPSDNF